MKIALLAATLLLTALAAAAPPAHAPASAPARAERAARAEKAMTDLKLTEAQRTAMRDESQRFRAELRAERAAHRANVAKILTAEQLKQLEDRRRARFADRCDDEDDEAVE